MNKETFIEEKTSELKQYVGLGMSKEECRIFITTTCYGFLQASADQSKLLLSDVSSSFSLDFIKWYSGMEEQKILNAFERYKRESGNDR